MSALTQTLLWLAIPLLGVVLINAALLAIAELKVRAAFAADRVDVNDPANMAGINWLLVALKTKHGPMMALLAGETLLVACTYSLFRLITAMTRPGAGGRTIADGRTFTWQELWENLTTYYIDQPLTLQATAIAAAWIFAVNLAAMFHQRWAYRLLTILVRPLLVLLVLGAAFLTLIGLCVWALAGPLGNPHYNMEMLSLYVFWVVLLLGEMMGLFLITATADAIYVFEQ